jgi:hypothetical protein
MSTRNTYLSPFFLDNCRLGPESQIKTHSVAAGTNKTQCHSNTVLFVQGRRFKFPPYVRTIKFRIRKSFLTGTKYIRPWFIVSFYMQAILHY